MIKEELRYVEFIQDVLISIHENLRELEGRKTYAGSEELTHINAKIIAYQEMISIMRMSAETCGLSKNDIGL